MILALCLGTLALGCKKTNSEPPAQPSMYFPPIGGTEWSQTDPASLNWNAPALSDLDQYLASTNTKAFLILHQGKIVHERYFGTFKSDSIWYWASAGKTVTALAVMRLLPPTAEYAGDIYFDGLELLALPEEDMRRLRGILEQAAKYADSGWASVYASWVCDDNKYEESALKCRRRAVDLFGRAKLNEQEICENKDEEEALIIDLLRRIGEFDEAQRRCLTELEKTFHSDLVWDILYFEKKLIENRDRGCHTVDEAEASED